MPMYRKKPVAIEAIEWTGENIDEIAAFLGWRNFSYDKQHGLHIHTLEGTHAAIVTDMIIKGVKGEFYPCKADIFAATYDTEDVPKPEDTRPQLSTFVHGGEALFGDEPGKTGGEA